MHSSGNLWINSYASITITFACKEVIIPVYSYVLLLFMTISSPKRCPEEIIHNGTILESYLL